VESVQSSERSGAAWYSPGTNDDIRCYTNGSGSRSSDANEDGSYNSSNASEKNRGGYKRRVYSCRDTSSKESGSDSGDDCVVKQNPNETIE
jgi:hypothetical protein